MAQQHDVKERWGRAWRTEKRHVSLQGFERTQAWVTVVEEDYRDFGETEFQISDFNDLKT